MSGVNATAKSDSGAESGAAIPSAPVKKSDGIESTVKYNPMANLLERHESAINRIKRGK